MTAFSFWYPGDVSVIWAVNVMLQVTLVTTTALLVARVLRQNPAARYWMACSALFLVLLSPLTSLFMMSSRIGLLSVSLGEDGQSAPMEEPPMSEIEEPKIEEAAHKPPAAHTDRRFRMMDSAGDVRFEPETAISTDALAPTFARERRMDFLKEEPAGIAAVSQSEGGATAVSTEVSAPTITRGPDMDSLEESPAGAASVSQPERVSPSPEFSLGAVLRATASAVLLLWFVIGFFFLARLLRGWWKLAHIMRTAQPLNVESLEDIVADACRALGTTRFPRLVSSPNVKCPLATGVRHPLVILPEGIREQLNRWQLRDVLIHEVAHVLRRDQVVVLLQNIVAAVFWLHPLVHVLNRRLACAREEICDNHVLASSDAPSYSRTLLRLAELIQGTDLLPASIGQLTSHWDLETRVAGILSERRNKTTRLTTRGLALVAMMSLALATLGVGTTITVADADDPPPQALAVKPAESPDSHTANVRTEGEDETRQQGNRSPAARTPTDEEFRDRLLAIDPKARWHVGADIGQDIGHELALLPGDRAFDILDSCWAKIEPGTKRDIMMGFMKWYRGKRFLNPRTFDVLHLGHSDRDAGVRACAISYLNECTFRDFTADSDSYAKWRAENTKRDANQVARLELERFLSELKSAPRIEAIKKLKVLAVHSSYISSTADLVKTFQQAEFEPVLDQWVSKEWFFPTDGVVKRVRELLTFQPRSENTTQSPWNVTAESTDEEWFEALTSLDAHFSNVATWLGIRLSQLKEDRGYRILEACWPEIPPGDKSELLRGFWIQFSDALHQRYFDVMHLGWKDGDAGVQDFAATCTEWLSFRSFESAEEYDVWRASTANKSAEEIVAGELDRFISELDDAGRLEAPTMLDQFYMGLSAVELFPSLQQRALDAKVIEHFERWVDQQWIPDDGKVNLCHRMLLDKKDQTKAEQPLILPVDDELAEITQLWHKAAAGDKEALSDVQNMSGIFLTARNPKAIPTLIGMIDADNSYDTIYGIGYHVLSRLVDVDYEGIHDGAWWRRWWEKNRANYPEEVARIDIPDLPKTPHGRQYVPYPDNIDTPEGQIAALPPYWSRKVEGKWGDWHFRKIIEILSENNVEAAIPHMIGIIQADNSYDTVRGVGRAVGEITGIEYSPFHDGAWWRRWWERNKGKFADRVDDLTIPEFVKTEHGKNYVPFPEKVDTDEGKIELIVEEWKDYVAGDGDIKTISNLAWELGEARVECAIPVLIGIVDADNSREIRSVTGSLKALTGVPSSGLTDGPFWRRWWQRNKDDYSLTGQDAEIPDLPKTEHGKSYVPYPDSVDTIEGRIELLGQLWKQHVGGVDNLETIERLVWEFDTLEEKRAVPTLIAIMDADNSYRIRRMVGRGLSEITGIEHHAFKDSRAWRAWWVENGRTFAPGLKSYAIPDLPTTEFGKNFEPFPDDIDRLDVKIRWIRRQMRRGLPIDLGTCASAIPQMHPEVKTISFLIGLHRSLDPESDAATLVDRYAISEMVGRHVKRSDDESWADWWRVHGTDFTDDPDDLMIPDLSEEVRLWMAANAAAKKQNP